MAKVQSKSSQGKVWQGTKNSTVNSDGERCKEVDSGQEEFRQRQAHISPGKSELTD